jgi:hypothetical protein
VDHTSINIRFMVSLKVIERNTIHIEVGRVCSAPGKIQNIPVHTSVAKHRIRKFL